MNYLKKFFNILNNRAFKICFFGVMAVAAFMLGKSFVAAGYRESWLGHAVLIVITSILFLMAVGEFALNAGRFSAVGYVVVTFFAALTCYVISPVWQALNVYDLSDRGEFLSGINGGYVGFAFLYGAAYLLTLLLGFVFHKKTILVKNA